MNTKETQQENLLDAETRAKLAGRIEVLEKVKALVLLPKLHTMTVEQVADYYEVDKEAIQKCYQRNKDEIDADGVMKCSIRELFERFGHDVQIVKTQYYTDFNLSDNVSLRVPNVGIRLFSQRAILRIGMLLRDSPIAREVRTQLLNTFEHASEEQRTQEITTEQQLYMNIAKAFMSGSKEELLAASKDAFDYQNRHIQRLEQSNKVLAAEILAWSDRASLNKAVRYAALLSNIGFAAMWQELYQELLYKHGINLKLRGKAPYIQHIREDEWGKVQQSLAAICEKYGLDIQEVVRASKLQAGVA